MKPVFVADIGNTRIKCALFKEDRCEGFVFPSDEIPANEKLIDMCTDIGRAPRHEVLDWPWTIAGVVPKVCEEFSTVLRKAGFSLRVVESYEELPLQVDVEAPEKVGLDRLLAAVAITKRVKPNSAAAIVSAGTAVTIDLVDSTGVFRGGVILPGLCMMAQALHDCTAQLPMLDSLDRLVEIPGRSTQAAILGGIHSAIGGAIDRVIEQYRCTESKLDVYLTGGDAPRITLRYCQPQIMPILVLVGLSVVASAAT
jgi:type III pantothenate kinase